MFYEIHLQVVDAFHKTRYTILRLGTVSNRRDNRVAPQLRVSFAFFNA